MANYSTLKAAVADVVKTNGTQAITGANLQSVLLSIINSIGGGGYIFAGVATPSTNAGTPDQNVFYIGGAGTYTNFGSSYTVPVGSIGIFAWNGSWEKTAVQIVETIDALDSQDANRALSANQGRVLKQLIDELGYQEENPEYIRAILDNNGKFLWGIRNDGSIEWGKLPSQLTDTYGRYEMAPGYMRAILDGDGRFLLGIRDDGSIEWAKGLPTPIKTAVERGLLTPWGSKSMTIIDVKKDGSGDYTTVQDAINSIHDASVYNQYEVRVHDDFYINELAQLWLINDPTQHSLEIPTSQCAYIVTKDFVHIRGVGGNRVVKVESPDVNMAGTCFQYIQPIFVTGNCKIEDMTFIVKGGRYAVHQDSSAQVDGLDSYKTTIYKNVQAIHLGNSGYTNGSAWSSQCAQANGFANGQTQIYINVTWETRGAATPFYGHTNPNYSTPSNVVMINCKALSTQSFAIPSWGGFSFSDLFSGQSNHVYVYNSDIQQYTGRTMGEWSATNPPTERPTKRYCYNSFIGHGNNKSVVRKEFAEVLCIESANAGDRIDVIGGTAYDDIWGGTHQSLYGNGIRGFAEGSNLIRSSVSSQVYNLAYILGNCANSHKTLIVQITHNGTATSHTITFDQNYMTSDGSAYNYTTQPAISQESIIEAVNASFSDNFTMSLGYEFVDTFDDCKDDILLKGDYTAQLGRPVVRDLSLGYHGYRVANDGETPDGFAMERIGVGSRGHILLARKNLFHAELFGIETPLTIGTMYKIQARNVVETQSAQDAVLVAIDESTLMFNEKM